MSSSLSIAAPATLRPVAGLHAGEVGGVSAPAFRVIRRNGASSPFDPIKITVAVTKAFLAVEGQAATGSRRVHEAVDEVTEGVVSALTRRADAERALHIEDIQDQVELALMRAGHHKVARAYVLYREERAKARREAAESVSPAVPALGIRGADGVARPLDERRLAALLGEAAGGLEGVSTQAIDAEMRRNLYDGMSADELSLAAIMAARTLVEREPNYAQASARLLLDKLRREALSHVFGGPREASGTEMDALYAEYFPAYLATAVAR
jgi:ribonucleoside-diphosphate reductase alpha chain